jgi:hypothetical protein
LKTREREREREKRGFYRSDAKTQRRNEVQEETLDTFQEMSLGVETLHPHWMSEVK